MVEPYGTDLSPQTMKRSPPPLPLLLSQHCWSARLEEGLFLAPMENRVLLGSIDQNEVWRGMGSVRILTTQQEWVVGTKVSHLVVERPGLAKAVFLYSCMPLCGFIRWHSCCFYGLRNSGGMRGTVCLPFSVASHWGRQPGESLVLCWVCFVLHWTSLLC